MKLPWKETLASLPPEWPHPVLDKIRSLRKQSNTRVVVLDDDPTGTQTVRDIPVLTEWSAETLRQEFERGTPLFYILTNSRSLPEPEAIALAEEVGSRLATAAAQANSSLEVVSRGDSTLRGHYPMEVDALAAPLGWEGAPQIIAPFFEEGGRLTLEDIHYVGEADTLIPAAETPFAQDASFGFKHSNLREWVEEKTQGRIPASHVISIPLNLLRQGGPDAVARELARMPAGSACVVNAVSMRDIEVFVLGWLQAAASGHRFLCRSAASLVRALAGQSRAPLLDSSALKTSSNSGGLVVVGSHVPKSTSQLKHLLDHSGPDLLALTLNVSCILDPRQAEAEWQRVATALNEALSTGRHAVIHTSREQLSGRDAAHSLEMAHQVSENLVRLVQHLDQPPAFLVAKGGITSSDIATRGLKVRRAQVAGQILPGIPVWRLGQESRFPGLPYVVFPGNVGSEDALTEVFSKLHSSTKIKITEPHVS